MVCERQRGRSACLYLRYFLGYKVDAKGALLPDNLIVSTPQQHLTPERLTAVMRKPTKTIMIGRSLETPRAAVAR